MVATLEDIKQIIKYFVILIDCYTQRGLVTIYLLSPNLFLSQLSNINISALNLAWVLIDQ